MSCEHCDRDPTRRHLTCHCPCPTSAALREPACGVEEGLCLPLAPRGPPWKQRRLGEGMEDIVAELREKVLLGDETLIATDGGAEGRCFDTCVGSWAVVVNDVNASGWHPGNDQSSAAARTVLIFVAYNTASPI